MASLQQNESFRGDLHAELKQRLEDLRLSEEKFATVFQSSPVMMVIQNLEDRKYLDVNKAFTKVMGYQSEEAIGRTPSELSLYATSDEAKRVTQAFLKSGGGLRNFEFEFQKRSGELGTGLLSSETIEYQGFKALLGIVVDITERKRAVDEIRRLNSEMERRIAERSWQLSTLLDLAFLVSHHDTGEHIFQPALERLIEISGLEAVCIHTISIDKQYLRLEAQVGFESQELDQISMLLPSGFFATWLAKPKNALIFSSLVNDAILPDPLHPRRLGSCLVAQLVAKGDVLGTMSCFHKGVHTFSLDEVSLLVAVAEQLGTSLENQRLRREAEQLAAAAERARLARDLHDSITQSLYSLVLFTRSSLDAWQEQDSKKLAVNLKQIESNALLALREMRLLLFQMQPDQLEDGFENAINARFDLVERRLGIEATYHINQKIQLSPEVERTLFRIALEAANNSLKHAQAKHIHISLEKVNNKVVMEVSDDGVGFNFEDQYEPIKLSGLGLRNMQSRAAELNGNLEIISSPGNGTQIRLTFDDIPDHINRSKQ